MGAMNGANMLRVIGVLTTAALMANAGHAPSAPTVRAASPASAAAIDVDGAAHRGARRAASHLQSRRAVDR